jgi:hypothetical protein
MAWNFFRKRHEVKRIGSDARSIVCSRCVQKILASGPGTVKEKKAALAAKRALTPGQVEAAEKFFGGKE